MIKHLALLAFLILSTTITGSRASTVAATSSTGLAGTNWVLTQYSAHQSPWVPAVGTHAPTLKFGTDGTVSGNGGCNSFGGTYTEATGEITFSPLIRTLMACADPAVNTQEGVIMSVLTGVNGKVTFTLAGDQLTLSTPSGILVFAASNGQGTPGMPPTGNASSGWLLALLLIVVLAAVLGVGLRRLHSAL
jgi:heat shock protein HslJ